MDFSVHYGRNPLCSLSHSVLIIESESLTQQRHFLFHSDATLQCFGDCKTDLQAVLLHFGK